MAKPRGDDKRKVKGTKAPSVRTIAVEGILRLRLLELEEEIGLLPYQREVIARQGRGARTIYDRREPAPAGMQNRFPEEIAAMRRLGKPTNKCFSIEFPPYRVACLPYFYYDGFHALLYVEKEGEFLAAWSEWEAEGRRDTHPVMVSRDEGDLRAFLDDALPVAHGRT